MEYNYPRQKISNIRERLYKLTIQDRDRNCLHNIILEKMYPKILVQTKVKLISHYIFLEYLNELAKKVNYLWNYF